MTSASPVVRAVESAFGDQVEVLGGRVTARATDGELLFLRAILGRRALVRPGDPVQGGVALRSDGRTVRVHTYLFREVCANGEIHPQITYIRPIAVPLSATEQQLAVLDFDVRAAVAICARPSSFERSMNRVREASRVRLDSMENLLASGAEWTETLLRVISKLDEVFERAGDRTLYGAANAVTALARVTLDPDTRWNLEELGGRIATSAPQSPRPVPLTAEAAAPTA